LRLKIRPGTSMSSYGKYQVLQKIGAGASGEVFKGFDPAIKRNVAIKTCTTPDEETRQRFSREAEISGNLHHPNIVTIYDLGWEGDVAYLVQEFLKGEDLDRKIKRREEIPYGTKLRILAEIASGLEYAHSRGVVHRDVKPGNVRILADGSCRLMDFGVAKLIHEESSLTRTGMTLGTRAYIAPEQIRGKSADGRSDMFSFGVTAYELLAYRRPFEGDSAIEVLHMIVEGEPPPLPQVWADCPEGIWPLVERCLEKEPGDRFADFGEVRSELERLRAAL
jgi:serine/threonine-protein kinase